MSNWLRVTVELYDGSTNPDIWACADCGTVSMGEMKTPEKCHVCELLALLRDQLSLEAV